MSDSKHVWLYAVGDVCVNRNEPESAFALSAKVTNEADIAFCQLETMYSDKPAPAPSDKQGKSWRSNLCAHPRNMAALTQSGFDLVSLAGNHVMDFGPEVLDETMDLLHKCGIKTVGAGRNIAEARKPLVIDCKGVRTAFLAYNSILPDGYWAEEDRAGCAPMRASTVYEPIEKGQPGVQAKISTHADQGDLKAMLGDIAEARKKADVVIVSLHWGIHFTPALLADYQREVGHAVIDGGADFIIGTHAHILKPIEVYRGKVITYSLCNFAFDLPLTAEQFEEPKRKEMGKYYPNRRYFADYPTYSFPVDSRKTMLVKVALSKQGVDRVSFLPVYINSGGQPEILKRADPRSQEVFDYMNDMSIPYGTALAFEGDEVMVRAAA